MCHHETLLSCLLVTTKHPLTRMPVFGVFLFSFFSRSVWWPLQHVMALCWVWPHLRFLSSRIQRGRSNLCRNIRARSHRMRKHICMQTLWCCLWAVWTLPLTTMCSIIYMCVLWGARPVWTGPNGFLVTIIQQQDRETDRHTHTHTHTSAGAHTLNSKTDTLTEEGDITSRTQCSQHPIIPYLSNDMGFYGKIFLSIIPWSSHSKPPAKFNASLNDSNQLNPARKSVVLFFPC